MNFSLKKIIKRVTTLPLFERDGVFLRRDPNFFLGIGRLLEQIVTSTLPIGVFFRE